MFDKSRAANSHKVYLARVRRSLNANISTDTMLETITRKKSSLVTTVLKGDAQSKPQRKDIWWHILQEDASICEGKLLPCKVKIIGRELRNILKYQKSLAHRTGTGEGELLLIACVGGRFFLKSFFFKVIIKILQTQSLPISLSASLTHLLNMAFLNNKFAHKIHSKYLLLF